MSLLKIIRAFGSMGWAVEKVSFWGDVSYWSLRIDLERDLREASEVSSHNDPTHPALQEFLSSQLRLRPE